MVWIGPWTTGPSFTLTACHTLSMPSAMMCTLERSVHMLLNLVTSSATALSAARPGPVRCSDLFDRSHIFCLQLVSWLTVIFLKFSYSPGVFGEQTFDSVSAYFHLERWLILRPVQGVAGKKPFTLQNQKEHLGCYLFLSAIYWNYFDCTSCINTSGEHVCMYITERYSEDQAVIVMEVSQPNF